MCDGGQAVHGVFMPLTHYWNGLQQEELHYSITLPPHLRLSVNLFTEPCFPLCGSFTLWKWLGDTPRVFDVAAWPLMEHQASASEPGEVLHQSADNLQKHCLAEEAKTVKLKLKQISLRIGAATPAISQSINQAIIQQLWILFCVKASSTSPPMLDCPYGPWLLSTLWRQHCCFLLSRIRNSTGLRCFWGISSAVCIMSVFLSPQVCIDSHPGQQWTPILFSFIGVVCTKVLKKWTLSCQLCPSVYLSIYPSICALIPEIELVTIIGSKFEMFFEMPIEDLGSTSSFSTAAWKSKVVAR